MKAPKKTKKKNAPRIFTNDWKKTNKQKININSSADAGID